MRTILKTKRKKIEKTDEPVKPDSSQKKKKSPYAKPSTPNTRLLLFIKPKVACSFAIIIIILLIIINILPI